MRTRRPSRPPRGHRGRGRRGSDGPRSEPGSAAVELVLLTPVLIALVFGLVQAGLLWNARHLTNAAAQHGARLARTTVALQPLTSTGPGAAADDAIRTSTLHFLRQTGGHALRHPTVQIQRSADVVTVTVTGTAVGVLPGTTVHLTSRSRTPVEGFRP